MQLNLGLASPPSFPRFLSWPQRRGGIGEGRAWAYLGRNESGHLTRPLALSSYRAPSPALVCHDLNLLLSRLGFNPPEVLEQTHLLLFFRILYASSRSPSGPGRKARNGPGALT